MATTEDFSGCKVAMFIGTDLLITLRDDIDHIPFPNVWDFPGGGREGNETPEQTLAREVMEEVGLDISESAVLWRRRYPAAGAPGKFVWFFVAHMPPGSETNIVFGDEGQGWRLEPLGSFLEMEQVVPSFASRLRDWMAETGGLPGDMV